MTNTIKIRRELRPLLERIDELEKLHGGLRAAANAIGIDAGYLSRLKSGEKFNPGEDVLAALGLERMTYYRDTRAELAYQDPEAMLGENRLHTVSTLVAGKAFNSLCRMLGGRWPDARMEQEAPEAYRFFMALLATPPADAADMGGQAGEEVESSGLIVERDMMGTMHIKLPSHRGGDPIDLVQVQYHYPHTDNASTKRLAEKIAGLISGKLEAVSSEELAQHRQQAGKLAEALDNLLQYPDEREQAREALADWEKTSCVKLNDT